MNLGLINLAKKDYDESLKYFQKIIELEPNNPEAIKTISYVYKKMDDIAPVDQTDSRGNIKTVGRHRFPKTTILVIILALLILLGGYLINQDILQELYSKFYHQKTISKLVSKKTTDMQMTTPQKPPVKDIKFDYRNTRWGMTKEQVKASETMKIVYEKESVILYHGELAGMETTVHYTFKEKMLLGCVQRFIGNYIDDNNYILDYKKAKDALTHKYGPPVTDEQLWSNNTYKDNPQDWGFAVRRGDLVFRSSWKFNYTEIGLGLNSNSLDNGIIHAVSYTIK
jgi:tetratricopeptide (TPR) repeat protein